MLFGQILEQTTKLNQEMAKNKPSSLPNILQGLFPPGAHMTITDLDTGETKDAPIKPGESLGKMNEIIMSAMSSGLAGSKDKSLNDMTVKELEKVLAKAIKEDDFEKAGEINIILKEKRNPSSDSGENNPE